MPTLAQLETKRNSIDKQISELKNADKKPFPKDEYDALFKEVLFLTRGTKLELKANGINISCEVVWECDEDLDIGTIKVLKRKGDSEYNSLAKMITDDDVLWDMFDRAIERSKEYKALNKRVKDICKNIEHLERDYRFSWDDVMDKVYERINR